MHNPDADVKCPECGLACPVSLSEHRRAFHDLETTLPFKDSTPVLIRRAADGAFHCPRCARAEACSKEIEWHALNCPGPPDAPMPPPPPSPPVPHDAPPAAVFPDYDVPPAAPPAPPATDDVEMPAHPHPAPPLAYAQAPLLHPGPDTVTTHDTYLLSNHSLVVDLRHRLLICLACHTSLPPLSAHNHLSVNHATFTKPPPGMVPSLTEQYGLLDPATLAHPVDRPAPVFGLELSPAPYFDCGSCGHAYSDARAVASHLCSRCLAPPRPNATGYAQRFTRGPRNSWFLVDLEQRAPPPEVDFAQLIGRLDLGIPDYTELRVSPTLSDSKKDTFIARESWDKIMAKIPPQDARELTRLSTSDDPFHVLGPAVVDYVARLQPQLRQYATYGQQRELADYGVQSLCLETFNTIRPESCTRYGRTLWALVFNLLRQVDTDSGYTPFHLYPVTPEQRRSLLALLARFRSQDKCNLVAEDYTETQRELDEGDDLELFDEDDRPYDAPPDSMDEDLPSSPLHDAIQSVVLSLFRHEQTGPTTDKFFSPVLLYLVLSSIKPDGALALATSITQHIAHLTYCGRGAIMLEIEHLLSAHPDWSFHTAHDTLKKYHSNGFVTPLVAMFQTFSLLKIVAQTEISPCDGHWADADGQVVDWKGVLVGREKLSRPYDALLLDISNILHRDIFFGRPTPPHLSADFFRNKDLADPAMNRATGFCALDHPPNHLRELAHDYLRWILSDPDLRARFSYYADGQIHWRPLPVKDLMDACDLLGLKIALAHQWAAPCLSRGTELANMSLRNTAGSTTRNFQIILNTVALISIVDKTTHKRLNYRHIPSASPTLLARIHLQLLVFLRPAQVFFARQFFGIDAAHRFHTALWPRVSGTLTGDMLSKHLGQLTHRHLGVSLRVTALRKFIGFWLKRHVSPLLQTSHAVIDKMASHSEQTAAQHYDQDSGVPAAVSANDVHHMLLVCRDWQRFIGVDRSEPLALSLQGDRIDERGTAAAAYRALDAHYGTPFPATPSSQPNTVDILPALAPRDIRMLFDSLGNTLATHVAASIKEEMIVQQAILHPTLPPIHAFHELRDVSNVEVSPCRRFQLREVTKRDDSDFVCVPQAIFFEKLATNTSNLLAILRCGLGKTWLTLAALPVLAPGKQLVWLIPTSGLQADTVLTARQANLTIDRWAPDGAFNTEADVVWAPIEIIAKDDFQLWVRQRVNAERIWNGPAPLLPLLFGLSGITTWDILRMPTPRSNIALRTQRYQTHAEARTALIAEVHTALDTLAGEDRIMIFCRKRDMATDIAEVFDTDAYLAPGQSDPAQAQLNAALLPAWRLGLNLRQCPCRVVVSTSILGTGLNYAHVRFVFMLERPNTLFDYQQQVERSGRDNKPATSSLHSSDQDSLRIPNSVQDVHLGIPELELLATSSDACLRSIPSLYFDGIHTTCMTTTRTAPEPTEFCSHCKRLATQTPPSRPVPVSTVDTRLVIGRQDPIQRLIPLDVVRPQQNASAPSASHGHFARAAPPPAPRRRAGPVPPPPHLPVPSSSHAPVFPPDPPLPSAARPRHAAPSTVARAAPPPRRPPIPVAPAAPVAANARSRSASPPRTHAATSRPPPPSRWRPPPRAAPLLPNQPAFPPQPPGALQAHATGPRRPPPARAPQETELDALSASSIAVASRPPARYIDASRRPALTHNDLLVQHGASFLPRIVAQGNVWATRRDVLARVWSPALQTIRAKCPYCWALGQLHDEHAGQCPLPIAPGAPGVWGEWGKMDGICWTCRVPHRKDGWHADISPQECPDGKLLLPAAYAYLAHPPADLPHSLATFLPRSLVSDAAFDWRAFAAWAHTPVPDNGPMLRLHVLFLWLLVSRRALPLPPELRSLLPLSSLSSL
ncbi:hypothetical protein B0H15DRAFT_952539 [Mycena belliarum]|uniref:DNA 3'-5' helicase n=1 Tax=Mycena belliarum TaxID=1033014 RepID=A0AAD6XNP3_9AGAR|nr:hypothetical protein B0H15DRAFT_952539 [Mycena belliae]